MQLRPATPTDKSAIIDLLKKSLGESRIPKSELLWNWKHEQNPFGASYVLLAEESNKLIGLRAFMQWQWRWNSKIYKAIRAVDTATDPDHQGKGIFKKLTLHQIGICKQEGVHFVFNTPNEKSKPGYLKMGWVEQGKLPLKFKILRPVSLIYSKLFKKDISQDVEDDAPPLQPWGSDIINLIPDEWKKNDRLSSNLSRQYISWRYGKNPLFRYDYFTDHSNFLLISRIKKHSFAQELRIVEFILLKPATDSKKLNNEMGNQVLKFCTSNNIDFISMSGLQYSLNKSCFQWMGFLPVRALGPSITLKDINMNEQFKDLLPINNWAYSLGDLELF